MDRINGIMTDKIFFPNLCQHVSMLDQVQIIVEKINELIDNGEVIGLKIIELKEELEYLLNNGLSYEVCKKILEMYEEGLFTELINVTVFNDLNNKINSLLPTLKYYGNEKITELYVAPTGIANDNNNGLSILEPITIKKAFSIINDYRLNGNVLNGIWRIKLKAGIYKGVDTNCSLTNIPSTYRIEILGEEQLMGGTPTTIFDGESLNTPYKHGLAFERCDIYMKDILFRNFKEFATIGSTQTRCGVSFTNGNTVCINVWASFCSWAGINVSGGRVYTSGGRIDNCRIGIGVQFNAQCSLGWIDKEFSDVQRCTITNCIDAAIKLADGTVGHIDYINVLNNINGIVYTHHSDSNLVECRIENNTIGIILENASSFFDTNNIFLNNSANDIVFRDGSSESTMRQFSDKLVWLSRTGKGMSATGEYDLETYSNKFNRFRNGNMNIISKGEISNTDGNSVDCVLYLNDSLLNKTSVTSVTSGYKPFTIEYDVLYLSNTQVKIITTFTFMDKVTITVNEVTLTQNETATFNLKMCNVGSGLHGYRSFLRKFTLET